MILRVISLCRRDLNPQVLLGLRALLIYLLWFVFGFRYSEELSYDHVVDPTEVNYSKQGYADEEAALAETSHIADPVQDVVDLAVDDSQVHIELKCYRYVNGVFKLIRPLSCFTQLEYTNRI